MGVQVTVWPRGTRRVRNAGPFGINFNAIDRRVGNPLFVEQYGELTAVNAGTRYEPGFGGHDLASWTVKPHGGYVGGLMRPGDHVRITKGGSIVFDGEYSEAEPADDGTITLHAKGYAHNLYDYDAIFLDVISGSPDVSYPTTKLGAWDDTIEPYYGWAYAVTQLGMPINQVVGDTSFWTNSYGESDMAETSMKVGELVTAVHQEAGERWAVWGRTLYVGPDETDPSWSYSPPAGVVGVADSDFATHVFVRYVDASRTNVQPWSFATSYAIGDRAAYGGTWWQAKLAHSGTVPVEGSTWTEIPVAYRETDFGLGKAVDTDERIARFDTKTAMVDYRGLGAMTDTRANNLAKSLLDQVRGRFTLTGSFTVGPDSGLTSAAGGTADIAFVHAGHVLKMPGLRTDQGNLMDTDTTVIGKTDWSWSADGTESLQITPMGAVPRSLGEILRGNPLTGNTTAGG